MPGLAPKSASVLGMTRGTLLFISLWVRLALPQAGGALSPAEGMHHLTHIIRGSEQHALHARHGVASSAWIEARNLKRRREVIIDGRDGMGRGVHFVLLTRVPFGVRWYVYVIYIIPGTRLLCVHGWCILRVRIVCMLRAYGTYT